MAFPIVPRVFAVAALGAGIAFAFAVPASAQQKVLRVVPHAEPKVFDPHQSQVNITSMHAAMVYDHLFSWDADMKPRPQMLESYTISPDKLTYAFTLRPGLKFHDGSAVTSRDAVATVKRLCCATARSRNSPPSSSAGKSSTSATSSSCSRSRSASSRC